MSKLKHKLKMVNSKPVGSTECGLQLYMRGTSSKWYTQSKDKDEEVFAEWHQVTCKECKQYERKKK